MYTSIDMYFGISGAPGPRAPQKPTVTQATTMI